MNSFLKLSIYLLTCSAFCHVDQNYYESLFHDLKLCFGPQNMQQHLTVRQVLASSCHPCVCVSLKEGRKIIKEGKDIVPFLLKTEKSYYMKGCAAYLIMAIYNWNIAEFSDCKDYEEMLIKIEKRLHDHPATDNSNQSLSQEPIATRVMAMSVFDETGTYVEDLFFTHDALKNTTALFGIQAGCRALYEYGPYGSTIKMEGNAAEENPFRFSSEYFDEETGLVQYNFRYFNPTDGKWLSRDILGEMYTRNNYAFIKNYAILRFDLLGMYEYDEETKRKTKQLEKMINDCLRKFQGSGQYKAHPAALMPREFYNDYPAEIPPNCLAHE